MTIKKLIFTVFSFCFIYNYSVEQENKTMPERFGKSIQEQLTELQADFQSKMRKSFLEAKQITYKKFNAQNQIEDAYRAQDTPFFTKKCFASARTTENKYLEELIKNAEDKIDLGLKAAKNLSKIYDEISYNIQEDINNMIQYTCSLSYLISMIKDDNITKELNNEFDNYNNKIENFTTRLRNVNSNNELLKQIIEKLDKKVLNKIEIIEELYFKLLHPRL